MNVCNNSEAVYLAKIVQLKLEIRNEAADEFIANHGPHGAAYVYVWILLSP